jgi:hypothetical protein
MSSGKLIVRNRGVNVKNPEFCAAFAFLNCPLLKRYSEVRYAPVNQKITSSDDLSSP